MQRWRTNARAWRVNGKQVAYRLIRGRGNCPLRIREADRSDCRRTAWPIVEWAEPKFTATRGRASVLRIDAKD
uniref:Uncharacterized protein n=1 Tax=Paraburkholderia sprentiae WSM5005 TaxID=754502 RepID=A0A1I9YJS6_9BURK